MNPSSAGVWDNPPPPGTEVLEEQCDEENSPDAINTVKEDDTSKIRNIDRIDPFLKNPEYVEYEKRTGSREHSRRHKRSRSKSYERRRSRSRSRGRDKKSKDRDRKGKDYYRSRSRSRDRYRRSRSRGRYHRRYRTKSRSSSRSRSRSRSRYSRHKKDKRYRSTSKSRKRSRSYSRSRSRSGSHSRRYHRHKPQHGSNYSGQSPQSDFTEDRDETENVEDDDEPAIKENAFKNDGTFLELFKKMQEEQKAEQDAKEQASGSEVKKPLPAFGKRRGGRVLKTGVVQKNRAINETDLSEAQDAWTVYMKEVRRYKEACCDDDSKTRPLVK